MPAKPRGEIKGAMIGAGPEGTTVQRYGANLPNTRRGIEEWVIKAANAGRGYGVLKDLGIRKITASPEEQDLDSTVEFAFGQRHLELTEFIPKSAAFHGDYTKQPRLNCGEIADQLVAAVLKKSAKNYSTPAPPWLGIYVTDTKFSPPGNAVTLTKVALVRQSHIFERVLYLMVFPDGSHCLAAQLFPFPAVDFFAAMKLDEAMLRADPGPIMFDTAKPIINEDGSVSFGRYDPV